MARFDNVAELTAFLCKLNSDYGQYGAALWRDGVSTSQQLTSASTNHLLSIGLRRLHIDDIKARAGEPLPYSNLFQHHCCQKPELNTMGVGRLQESSKKSGFTPFRKMQALSNLHAAM